MGLICELQLAVSVCVCVLFPPPPQLLLGRGAQVWQVNCDGWMSL